MADSDWHDLLYDHILYLIGVDLQQEPNHPVHQALVRDCWNDILCLHAGELTPGFIAELRYCSSVDRKVLVPLSYEQQACLLVPLGYRTYCWKVHQRSFPLEDWLSITREDILNYCLSPEYLSYREYALGPPPLVPVHVPPPVAVPTAGGPHAAGAAPSAHEHCLAGSVPPADAAVGPAAPPGGPVAAGPGGTIAPLVGGVQVPPEYCTIVSVSSQGPDPGTVISLPDGATPEIYPAGASYGVPPVEFCHDGVLSHSDGVLSIGELVGDGITCDSQANIQSVTSATVPPGKVTYNNQLILPACWCPAVTGVVGTGLHPNPDVAGWDPFQHFFDSPAVTVGGASIGLYSSCDDVGCDLYPHVSSVDPHGSDPPGFPSPKSGAPGLVPPEVDPPEVHSPEVHSPEVCPPDLVFSPVGPDEDLVCHSTPVGITIPDEDPPLIPDVEPPDDHYYLSPVTALSDGDPSDCWSPPLGRIYGELSVGDSPLVTYGDPMTPLAGNSPLVTYGDPMPPLVEEVPLLAAGALTDHIDWIPSTLDGEPTGVLPVTTDGEPLVVTSVVPMMIGDGETMSQAGVCDPPLETMVLLLDDDDPYVNHVLNCWSSTMILDVEFQSLDDDPEEEEIDFFLDATVQPDGVVVDPYYCGATFVGDPPCGDGEVGPYYSGPYYSGPYYSGTPTCGVADPTKSILTTYKLDTETLVLVSDTETLALASGTTAETLVLLLASDPGTLVDLAYFLGPLGTKDGGYYYPPPPVDPLCPPPPAEPPPAEPPPYYLPTWIYLQRSCSSIMQDSPHIGFPWATQWYCYRYYAASCSCGLGSVSFPTMFLTYEHTILHTYSRLIQVMVVPLVSMSGASHCSLICPQNRCIRPSVRPMPFVRRYWGPIFILGTNIGDISDPSDFVRDSSLKGPMTAYMGVMSHKYCCERY